MSGAEEPDQESQPCVVCHSRIPKSAEKCTYCNEYQNSFKRNALFVAQIANTVAIGTFVAAVLVAGMNLLSNLRVRLLPEASIEFFSYDSTQLSLANTGDGAIFVDSISFKRIFPVGKKEFSTQDYSFFAIKKVVEEGGFLEHRFYPTQPFIQEKNSQIFGQRFADGTELYEWTVEAIIKNREKDEFGKACVYMTFFSSEDYSYQNSNELLKRQGFEEGVFKIWYISDIRYYSMAQKQWRSHPLMVVSVPTLSQDEKCDEFRQAIHMINQANPKKDAQD